MASLKGAIALYIVAYHYWAWGIGQPDDWAVNLAQFGVVLFFIMSGYGLSQGYQSPVDWRRFWVRRARRILPWFWGVTLVTIALKGWPGVGAVALNLSLLWPVFDLRGYIATGAWAVGCEAVFYALFWMWGLLRFTPWLGWAGIGLSTLFGYAALFPDLTLAAQWDGWVNPATQTAAFLAGVLLVPRLSRSWVWVGLWVALCVALPTPWAVYWFRPVLIVAGCGVVATVASIKSPVDWIGKYSYQIYLGHPVVWFLFS